jgi:glucosamine--fructose-6-phosphate aminotransferase (isomerizing)
MCGIVGYIGKDKCIPKILCGLESLEYRGYDSAGIAYRKANRIIVKKEQGRLSNLKELINMDDNAYVGIGHTRWATHGKPSKVNSHPHVSGDITLVHNGIIENYEELKDELLEYKFVSETDTEVVPQLLEYMSGSPLTPIQVFINVCNRLKGSYAIACMNKNIGDHLFLAKQKSPLYVATNGSEIFVATIINTTIKPVSVVMVACSSLPDFDNTWFRIATIMPMAATLKIRSISIHHINKITSAAPAHSPNV